MRGGQDVRPRPSAFDGARSEDRGAREHGSAGDGTPRGDRQRGNGAIGASPFHLGGIKPACSGQCVLVQLPDDVEHTLDVHLEDWAAAAAAPLLRWRAGVCAASTFHSLFPSV